MSFIAGRRVYPWNYGRTIVDAINTPDGRGTGGQGFTSIEFPPARRASHGDTTLREYQPRGGRVVGYTPLWPNSYDWDQSPLRRRCITA